MNGANSDNAVSIQKMVTPEHVGQNMVTPNMTSKIFNFSIFNFSFFFLIEEQCMYISHYNEGTVLLR